MAEMVMIRMKKIVFLSALRCYRSACGHPFLVAALCFLVFLYRLSPFVFSLLVSASPVLICTALLLGTLLSLGQPNLPEIEQDDPHVVCLKTGLLGDTTVVHSNEQLDSVANGIAEVVRGDSVVERDLNLGVSKDDVRKRDSDNEDVEDDDEDEDEDVERQNDRSPAESFGSERVNVDSLDSPPGSPWKHVEPNSENDDGEETDSGSDGAESSSPDASMADIIPMLDELHPLLEEDAPHPAPLSHDGFDDAGLEHEHEHTPSSSDSDENMEKDEHVEAIDKGGDDEDEGQGSRDGQTQSAIIWTEEDQKNVMDLGTSELERNQRLESLIARRRARKKLVERNLIDFDATDLPFNVAPIATAKNNPFDLPHDDMGLPPIPGSAPSILARRNPFDLPYDSNEEKPYLLGDSFEQEFESAVPKEPFFRRHESFNIGPSFFAPSRLGHDGRSRSYFAAEKMHAEGTSYASIQRQLSGVSESKADSVPETDSVASAGDSDTNILLREQSLGSVEINDSSRDFDYRNISGGEEDVSRELDGNSVKGDKTDALQLDEELISNIEHVSEHVGHGSQTSEESDFLDVGERENEGIGSYTNLISFEEEHASSSADLYAAASSVEDGKQDSGCISPRDRMFSNKEGGGMSSSEVAEDAGIVTDDGPSCNMTTDISHKEPVYDSSPTADNVSSDLDLELQEQPTLRTVSFVERELDLDGSVDKYFGDGQPASRTSVAESSSDTKSSQEGNVQGNFTSKAERELESSRQDSDGSGGKDLGDDQPASRTSVGEPSSGTKITQESAVQGDFTSKTERELESSRQDLDGSGDKVSGDDQPASRTSVVEPSTSSDTKSSQESVVQGEFASKAETEYREDQSSSSIDRHIHAVDGPHAGIQTMLEHSVENEADVASDALIETHKEQISAHNLYALEEAHIAEYGEELVYLDKSTDEASSSRENHGDQNATVLHEGLTDQSRFRENLNTSTAEELEQEIFTNINSPTSPESISFLSEARESRAAEGYSDVESNGLQELGDDDDVEEMKEIDEAFLSELDAVGDFSITNQVRSLHHHNESHEGNGQSSVLPNPSRDGVRTEEIKDTSQTSSELPVEEEEAGHADDEDKVIQPKSVAEAELLQPTNVDYDQENGQSSVLLNPSQDVVHVEEIKDFGQTSSELPAVEAGHADDENKVVQSKPADRS